MTKPQQNRVANGIIWSAVERFSVQGVQFLLSIVIARLISPSDYGLIAMLGIFLAVAQQFIDSGFSNALVQKKDRSDVDFSTVFYSNLAIAAVVYAALYAAAPWIADFYSEPKLTPVTRWIGLTVVLMAFSIVQRAKLTIELDFKTQAKLSFVSVTARPVRCRARMARLRSLGAGRSDACEQLSELLIVMDFRPMEVAAGFFMDLFPFAFFVRIEAVGGRHTARSLQQCLHADHRQKVQRLGRRVFQQGADIGDVSIRKYIFHHHSRPLSGPMFHSGRRRNAETIVSELVAHIGLRYISANGRPEHIGGTADSDRADR